MRFLSRSLLGLFLLALTLALLAVAGVTLKAAFDVRNADTARRGRPRNASSPRGW